MTKTTWILLAAVVLVGVAFVFVRNRDVDRGTEYPQRQFAVDSPKDVARLFIADMTGRTMDLRLQPDGVWLINDSIAASPSLMQQVTRTLAELKIDHVPPRATQVTVLKEMSTNALKVEVYNTDGEKIRNLLIGSGTPKSTGSYMMVEGYNEVFAVRRGMMTGIIRPLFDLRDVASWRSRDFIAYRPEEIQSVEVSYPRRPSESFRIVRTGDSLRLDALNELTGVTRERPQQRRLEGYLEAYEKIPLSEFADESIYRDSISAMIPVVQIVVELRDERSDTFELQPMLQLNEKGARDASLPFSSYWAEWGRHNFVTVQDHQINPALKTYQSFFD